MAKKYYSKPVKAASKSRVIFWSLAVAILLIAAALTSYAQPYNNFADWVNAKVTVSILPHYPNLPYKLGLDLQGGSQLVYRADLSKIAGQDPNDAMQGVRDVIERRVNSLGVSEPLIQVTKEGNEHRLIVELAGINDVKEAIQKIGETPLLEFKKENPTPDRPLTADEQKQLDSYNADQHLKAVKALTAVEKDPGSFETVVKDQSEDLPAIKDKKGDLGILEKGGAYPKIFAAVSVGYKDDSIVPKVIEDESGYSVARLNTKTTIESVTASHILICFKDASGCPADKQISKEEALAKITDLKKQATTANFAELAKANSTDTGSAAQGGDLGTFKRGTMVKEFEDVAFSMKVGTISDPVLTQFGYHIIYKRDTKTEPGYDASRIFFKKKLKSDIVTPEKYINTGLSGSNLKRANVQFQGQTNEPVVAIEFDKAGSDMFAKLTEENLNKTIAIYLDGEVLSAPRVQSVISNGQAVITGSFTIEEAKQLARRLNSGALPVPIELISQQTVGPTLGQASLDQSIKAGYLAIILVALFMILLYRVPGLISSICLVIYGAFILALFKLVGVTLTLAGIAGLVLTIGMAVDVNVLIFARFKEELALGKPYNSAMDEAFKRAWPSIRDGHVSTLITALILMQFSTSFVKGFALTLAIGVLLSLFTAMVIVRLFMRFIASKNMVNKFPWLFLNKKTPKQ